MEITEYLNKNFMREDGKSLIEKQRSDKIGDLIPFITFPDTWRIQVLPTYGSNLIRYRVIKENIYLNVVLNNSIVNGDTGNFDIRCRVEAENHPNKMYIRFYLKDYPDLILPIKNFIKELEE